MLKLSEKKIKYRNQKNAVRIGIIIVLCVVCLILWTRRTSEKKPEFGIEIGVNTVEEEEEIFENTDERWLIVTSGEPDKLCEHYMEDLQAWTILIVDAIDAQVYRLHVDGCKRKAVDIDDAIQLDYNISTWQTAYYIAIKNGAKTIHLYDLENDEPIADAVLIPRGNFTGLIGRGGSDAEFDVALHFGVKDRRESFHASLKENLYSVAQVKSPIIQTRPMLVHNGPKPIMLDSNSSYLANITISISACEEWDKMIACVALSAKSFVAFDPSRSVIYSHDAFWALPPAPISEGLSSVWWAMAVQRLLWSTGNRIALLSLPPHMYNFHLDDAEWEDEISSKRDLKTHLLDWKCKHELFFECVKSIAIYMQGRNYITSREMKLILYWVQTLNHLGYSWPKIMPLSLQRVYSSHAVFGNTSQIPPEPPKQIQSCSKWSDVVELYMTSFMRTSMYERFSKVVLVVAYSKPTYETIPYFDFFHRSIFKHIIYCGTSTENIDRYNVNFVSFNGSKDGAFYYTCMALVMQMQLHAEGYMLTSDDVLLNIHELNKTDLEYIEQSVPKNISIVGALTLKQSHHRNITVFDALTLKQCVNGVCESPLNWVWAPMYKNELKTIIKTLKRESWSSDVIRTCVRRLQTLTGGENRFFGTVSEVFYVPASFAHTFVELAWLFLADDVYVDIAVPTLLHCIAEEKSIKYRFAVSLPFGEDRNRPWILWDEFIQNEFTYIHPSKLDFLTKSKPHPKELDYYCNKVLPYTFTELSHYTLE